MSLPKKAVNFEMADNETLLLHVFPWVDDLPPLG
jgi:hypothetical protein